MVTSKERVIKAFQGEKTDRVPVGIFLGGSWPIIRAGTSLEKLQGDPQRTAEIFCETNERLGADLFMVGTGATTLLVRALGGNVRFSEKGAPVILSELIQNEKDLEGLSIEKALQDPGIQWIRETARHALRISGEKRLILASGRAPFTLAGQLYGLENLSRALYKKKDFVYKLLDFTARLSTGYFRTLLEDGSVHGIFIADPTSSGDVISTRHFEEFALPGLKQLIDLALTHSAWTMVHICGDITDRIQLLSKTGVHSISVDTKVDLTEARKRVGPKVCLVGNVHPVEVLQFGTGEEVYHTAISCMEQGSKDGGFVLMPSCDLEAKVPEENIKMLGKAAGHWAGKK